MGGGRISSVEEEGEGGEGRILPPPLPPRYSRGGSGSSTATAKWRRREGSVEEEKAKYWKMGRSSCKSLFPNKGDFA